MALTTIERPRRWGTAFDPDITDDDIRLMTARPEIEEITGTFPDSLPLEGIIRNDMRIVRLRRGDILVREGEYGNSAFTLVEGELQLDVHSTISERDLGGGKSERQGILPRLAGLWRNTWVPEVRDVAKYEQRSGADGGRPLGTALPDVARVLESQELLTLREGDFFGEMSALGRTPRSATIFASSDSVVMEIRWQGLRDIMKYDADWRDRIYKTYRENALDSYLRNTDFLQGLGSDEIQKVVESALFETYGTFDWHGDFKRKRQAATEVGIATEGDYPDGLLLISAGFARLATGEGHGRRTVGYLSSGDTSLLSG